MVLSILHKSWALSRGAYHLEQGSPMSVSGKPKQVTHIKSDVKTKKAGFNQFVAI